MSVSLILSHIYHTMSTPIVPETLSTQYPELIKLILKTDSMDSTERQYWIDTIPVMKDEQIDRLYDILKMEELKLKELEEHYQEGIRVLNQKHLKE